MYELEKFTFFWNGPLSQWEASFFEINGVKYNCAQQYMMAEKARLFKDDHTLEMIMGADDPKIQRVLGREVYGFSTSMWQDDHDTENGQPYCWNVVWRGNIAKFKQNKHLLNLLIATEGTTLVETSPEDDTWGIGVAEGNPNCYSRNMWQGLNWLGQILTGVREELKRELETKECD